MKAHFRTANGRMTFEIDGDSPKALFKKLSLVQDIFDADKECGSCKSTDLRYRVRVVDENEYYELGCGACYARLQFGQNKKGGGLFPKRKDKDGNYIPNNGWTKYEKGATTAAAASTGGSKDEIDDSDVPF